MTVTPAARIASTSPRSACRFAVVAAPDSFVHKVFDMVDLRNLMPTYETLEEALADGGVIRPQTTRLRPV